MSKKKSIEIVIDEKGNASVDILNATGSSCKKDMDEWSALFGKAVKTAKKPEFYRQTAKEENKNTQGIG